MNIKKHIEHCKYNCGYEGYKTRIHVHENDGLLKEFISTDLSTFVDEGKNNHEIATNIKNCFGNIYGGNILVMVGDTRRMGAVWNLKYEKPYKRYEKCKGKHIYIYKLLESKHVEPVMDFNAFSSFCKGLIMDNIHILKICNILGTVLKGKYMVIKDLTCEIATFCYHAHYCELNIGKHTYTCFRSG